MKKHSTLKISLVAVILGFLLGVIVVVLTGRSPLNMFYAIFRSMTGINLLRLSKGINPSFILNWFLESMPIILTGLSVGFAYRTGLFNIGGEGQFIMGSVASSFVALKFNLPTLPHVILCLLAGILAGAMWGFIPGILKAAKNINEVVVCIMLNYVALYLANYLTLAFLPIDPNTKARTISFPVTAQLSKVFTSTASPFNWGFLVAIIAVFVYWVALEKTTLGYGLRATGFNQQGAKYAGMKVKNNIVYSMMIAGGMAGAAGSIVILGVFRYGRIFATFDNYGFDGISVALVGAASAGGIWLAGLLFGLLNAAGNNLQSFNIPKEIAQLIQASIIFLVAIQYGVSYMLDKMPSLSVKKLFEKKVKEENK